MLLGFLLFSTVIVVSGKPLETADDIADCVLECRMKMKSYMYKNLNPEVDIDSTICMALDKMYECLREDCELGDAFVEQVKKTVDTSSIVNCDPGAAGKQTDLAVSESGSDGSGGLETSNGPSFRGITKCIATCKNETTSTLETMRTQPLANVLTNITFEQGQKQTEEACRSVDNLIKCFEDKCQIDGDLLTAAKSKIEDMEILEVCEDKELQADLLRCEIDNKQKFVENCGHRNLTEFSAIMEETPRIMGELTENPYAVLTPKFRNHFSQLCRYTNIIVKCSHKTYKENCSERAKKYMTKSLSQVVNLATPEELALLGKDCKAMAEVIDSLE